ncbi:hypothetical protein Dfri01_59330 [Dyadobacter frigoris]|uniref:GNAT family N-acetyltransferase n=1 Tax=Dyadobacter frigoris TaxID=2576211 RepID=UPI0024A5AAC7|nr:GNAT family N-acetyltransferase [Dyadobacter frigoris]GLU56472.1 hypothetical protein Dfri01_59330 [Dyadobacter frigoris]
MREAQRSEKSKIINILTNSFLGNKSIDYLIPNDSDRIVRIEELMSYSFELCFESGKVYISDDGHGCALISFPDKKKFTVRGLIREARLVLLSLGLRNALKAMKREKAISKHYANTPIYYLWFIGVQPDFQDQGIGGRLLSEVLLDAEVLNRKVYLETSTLRNIGWYERFGLRIYHELDFGYRLFLISSEK